MAWLRLTLETDAGQVEPVTTFLEQFNAISISYQPGSSESRFAGVGDDPVPWNRTSISALIDPATDMDILLICLRNRIGTEMIFRHGIELVEDQDWIESYRHGAAPLVFADRLCICPSWLQPGQDCECVVTLDPGLAFGSGTHPTTQMCLEWLASGDLRNRSIIDYGCGSGILALAAGRLGAHHVYAVDLDPQALSASKSNVRLNRLSEVISVLAPHTEALPAVDILVANILLKPVLELSDLFRSLVKPGGYIVISGILSTQVTECLASYERWFKMEDTRYHDEWALLHGCRKNSN